MPGMVRRAAEARKHQTGTTLRLWGGNLKEEEQTHEQAIGINESDARGSTWGPGEQSAQPRDSGGAS